MSENSDERFVDRGPGSQANDPREQDGDTQPTEGEVVDVPADGSAEQETAAEQAQAPEDAESIEELRALAEQYRAKWQRATADFANYRRRMDEERKETGQMAKASLVINLLPVYDDLERAVNTVDAKLAGLNWVQGVEAIHRKFWHVLDSMGIEEVPADGERFDPECHEAVGEQPGEEGKVLHVAQKGYRFGGKVLRPAMVIVGTGEAEASS